MREDRLQALEEQLKQRSPAERSLPLMRSQPSKGIILLSDKELDKMRRVGRLAAALLNHLEPIVQPGISTQALNDEAERWTRSHGATSAQLGYAPPGYPPFPGSVCTSVNEVICQWRRQAVSYRAFCSPFWSARTWAAAQTRDGVYRGANAE